MCPCAATVGTQVFPQHIFASHIFIHTKDQNDIDFFYEEQGAAETGNINFTINLEIL